MIFVDCFKCNEPKIIYYEAGDPTMGKAERWVCEKCKTPHFTEHLSFGETMTEEEFMKRHPEATKDAK